MMYKRKSIQEIYLVMIKGNSIRVNKILGNLKNSSFFKDSAWSLLGNIVGRGLSLFSSILIANFLGKDVFGEFGIIKSTILTIGIFSTFGLGYTSTKYVADIIANKIEFLKLFLKNSMTITLLFSGLMASIVFVFANYLSFAIVYTNQLTIPLRIMSVLIVFNAITTTQIGVLSGFGKFKKLAKINWTIGILTFLLSVPLAYFFGLNGALFSLLIVQMINCILNFTQVRKEIPEGVDYKMNGHNMYKEIISFSLPIALQECVYAASSWLGMLVLIKNSNVGELGFYSASMQWNAVILFIPGILRNVILSHLSGSSNNQENHSKILKQTIIINFVMTIIPCLIIYIFSNIIEKFYGTTFKGVGLLISLACLITIFNSVSNVFTQAYISKGKNWLMFIMRFIRDFGALLLSFVLLTHNIFPGAKSLIISNLIFSIIFLIIMWTTYNFVIVRVSKVKT